MLLDSVHLFMNLTVHLFSDPSNHEILYTCASATIFQKVEHGGRTGRGNGHCSLRGISIGLHL